GLRKSSRGMSPMALQPTAHLAPWCGRYTVACRGTGRLGGAARDDRALTFAAQISSGQAKYRAFAPRGADFAQRLDRPQSATTRCPLAPPVVASRRRILRG